MQTADKRVETSVVNDKATKRLNDRTTVVSEDELARKAALEKLERLRREVDDNAKYATEAAKNFYPRQDDYLTRTGTINRGDYNTARILDRKLDTQATQATEMKAGLQRFVDSKQAEKMAVEELLKAIEQYTAQNRQLSDEIKKTAERAKRIQ